MAETKQVALGTILKLDATQGGTFAAINLVQQITPPPRERERIDAKVLGDTLDVPLLGIEAVSEMEFVHHWHPGESGAEAWDTLFDSADEADVQIITPHATPVTDEFSVQVVGLGPESLEPSGAYKRTITLLRTTDITRS